MSKLTKDHEMNEPLKVRPTSEPPQMLASETKGVRLRLFARTDVGRIRDHNEDNFLVANLSNGTQEAFESSPTLPFGAQGLLLAVCDGMGGAAAGEIASQMAVDLLFSGMYDKADQQGITNRNVLARRLVTSIEVAGVKIFQEAKSDRSRLGMGTTMTAACIVDDHLFLAQVGDSRAYILRNTDLVQVTRDQSLVNQLIEAGQLTEEEAENFEHNNIILQALGTSESVHVDLTYVELRKDDVLLMCSDGLSSMMKSEELKEILLEYENPKEACSKLITEANKAGGHDNVTVILARFDGEGMKPHHDTDPPLRYQKYTLPPSSEEPTSGRTKATMAPLKKNNIQLGSVDSLQRKKQVIGAVSNQIERDFEMEDSRLIGIEKGFNSRMRRIIIFVILFFILGILFLFWIQVKIQEH